MKLHFPNASAFSLVEVTLALGITGFGLISIFGLIPVGLKTNQVSIQQAAAANAAAGIVADLRQTPTANAITAATAASKTLAAVSPRFGIDLTKGATKGYLDESGALSPGNAASLATSTLNANSHYQANITINNPSPAVPLVPPVRTTTTATVTISWPASAAPTNAAGSLTTFVALDRN